MLSQTRTLPGQLRQRKEREREAEEERELKTLTLETDNGARIYRVNAQDKQTFIGSIRLAGEAAVATLAYGGLEIICRDFQEAHFRIVKRAQASRLGV